MKLIELDKSKKIRFSFEDAPELVLHDYKTLETFFIANANELIGERSLVLELMISANSSYYALLGAKYFPIAGHKDLHIEVRYTEDNVEKYENTLAYSNNTVFKGLPSEYVETVIKTVIDYCRANETPNGKIIFNSAAHCEVGSSPLIFRIATKAVLRILLSKQYPVQDIDVEAICKECLLERFKV